MAGKSSIDWEYWRHKFVTTEMTLVELSQVPNAPALQTLKNRASKELWAEQRKQFQYQASTIASNASTAQEAVRQTQKFVDAAEIITSHIQIAKAMKSIAARRLKDFDPKELSPKDLASWVKMAADMERLAVGLATERQEVELSGNVDVNLSQLSDAQLERLAKGENVQDVID